MEDSKEDLMRLKREITLSTTPIRSILRNETLVAMLSETVLEEFQLFAEYYI